MIKRALTFLRTNVYPLFFFSFLTILLFFNDGKQAGIDIATGLVLLSVYAFMLVRHKPLPSPPWQISIAWFIYLVYLFIRSLKSDDLGYSLFDVGRTIDAYLIFSLFYAWSSKERLRKFCTYSGFFVCVAVYLSFLVILFPFVLNPPPLMSLIYPTYGHNPAVYVLVFIAPLIMSLYTQRKDKLSLLAVIVLLMLVMASLARIAIAIVCAFALARFLLDRKNQKKHDATTIPFLIIVLGFGLLVSLPRSFYKNTPLPTWLDKKLTANSSLKDGRLAYWAQATLAIKERPFFGSGPGTFALQSKRLQSSPNTYSWFAHNILLQKTVELGIVGAALFILLLYTVGSEARKSVFRAVSVRQDEEYAKPLLWGAALIFAYSLFDFTLDYIVVWMLFWAALGALVGADKHKHKAVLGICYTSYIVAFVFLIIFNGSYVASKTSALLGMRRVAIITAPYLLDATQNITPKTPKEVASLLADNAQLISFFHRRNPEVLIVLAKLFQQTNPKLSTQLFNDALRADKENIEYWKYYIQFIQSQPIDVKRSVIASFIALYGPIEFQKTIPEATQEELEYLVGFLGKEILPDKNDQRNNFVRIFYGLGVASLLKSPERTKVWWTLARDSNPKWSYVHIELAALEQHVFQNNKKAMNYLDFCQHFSFASYHCGLIARSDMPSPGFYQANIIAIPRVIN